MEPVCQNIKIHTKAGIIKNIFIHLGMLPFFYIKKRIRHN